MIIVVLLLSAFCHREIQQELNLLRWIKELDDYLPQHQCTLVASSQVTNEDAIQIENAARDVFDNVALVRQTTVDERGWPQSCNALFKFAASKVKGRSFLWIEPDLVPLKSGWLDEIEAEYRDCGKPFMGYTPTRPFLHLTGCAVYPGNIEDYNPYTLSADTMAWDATEPQLTLPHVFCSTLFQHEWGNHEKNRSPSFWTQRSLRIIRPDAVVLHRNKDQTLIKRLRERRANPRWCRFIERIWL